MKLISYLLLCSRTNVFSNKVICLMIYRKYMVRAFTFTMLKFNKHLVNGIIRQHFNWTDYWLKFIKRHTIKETDDPKMLFILLYIYLLSPFTLRTLFSANYNYENTVLVEVLCCYQEHFKVVLKFSIY